MPIYIILCGYIYICIDIYIYTTHTYVTFIIIVVMLRIFRSIFVCMYCIYIYISDYIPLLQVPGTKPIVNPL